MNRLIVIFSLFFISIVAFAQINTATKQKLAVYVIGDVENSYKKVIGSKMVSEIAKSPDYIAIERTAEFLAAITDEQDYQTSGNVTDSQIARLGQQFGVRYVAVVDASELLDQIFVSSRLIDVQSGVIVYSYDTSAPVEEMIQLINLSQDVAKGLIINPKAEERERLAAEQERIEQERQQKIEEERQAKLRREQEARNQEQQRQQRIREQAINNLITKKTGINPSNTFVKNGFIVLLQPRIAEFIYDPNIKRVIVDGVPDGWEVANKDIAQTACNIVGLRYPNRIIFQNVYCCFHRKGFNYDKSTGTWYVLVTWHDCGSHISWDIGETKKRKGQIIFEKSTNRNFYYFICRPMFTEYEIQQEMNRIK